MKIKSLLLTIFFICSAFQCENDENIPEENFTPQIWKYGSGTELDPYLIENAEHLVYLSARVNDKTTEIYQYNLNRFENKYFKIVNDINMRNISFESIGKSIHFPFKGNIDGNLKIISNLHLNSTSIEDASGLFGNTINSKIKNIILFNCSVYGKDYVGGISGKIINSRITNCLVTGEVVGKNYIGGIVGSNNGYSTIEKSSNEARVKGIIVGGISGELYNSNIIECFNIGEITSIYNQNDQISQQPNAGGISGVTYGSVINKCFNKGNINGIQNIGGITGLWNGPNSWNSGNAIFNCYNTGNITSSDGAVSGIIGQFITGGGIFNSYNIGYISSTVNDLFLVAPLGYSRTSSPSTYQSFFLYGVTANYFQFETNYGKTENYMKSMNFFK
jgi:hypothetical protein